MKIKNLIDHDTFILGKQPHEDELTIPVKLVLKAIRPHRVNSINSKLALSSVATDLENRRLKKAKAHLQQMTKEQREANANYDYYDAPPHVHQIVFPPEPFEYT